MEPELTSGGIIACSDERETPCPKSPDGQHCEIHWYEAAGPCCYCGDDTSSSARGFMVVEGGSE